MAAFVNYSPLMRTVTLQDALASVSGTFKADVAAILAQPDVTEEQRGSSALVVSLTTLVQAPAGVGRAEEPAFQVAQAVIAGVTHQDLPPIAEVLARCQVRVNYLYQNMAIPGMGARPALGYDWQLEVAAIPMTLNQVLTIAEALAQTPGVPVKVLTTLATGLIAYTKMGNVTQGVLRKVMDGVAQDLNIQITLDVTTVRQVWNFVKGKFSHERAGAFFRMWEDAVGTGCLRFTLLLQQAQWAGMTNYTNIMTAKARFPDFPWATLKFYVPEDFTNFATAVGRVRGDPYYGYRTDLAEARSTRFKTLSYVACLLLKELGAERSLADYQGVSNRVPSADEARTLVDTYVTAYRARVPGAPSADDLREVEEFRALANPNPEPNEQNIQDFVPQPE